MDLSYYLNVIFGLGVFDYVLVGLWFVIVLFCLVIIVLDMIKKNKKVK